MSEQRDWRNRFTVSWRARLIKALKDLMIKRFGTSHAEYGDSFVGDPLEEAREELVDGLFYIAAALEEREALKERIVALQQMHGIDSNQEAASTQASTRKDE